MNTTNHYPFLKVITLYALLGGFIGGMQVGTIATLSELDNLKEIPEFIGTLLFFGVLGILFGCIPATTAGFIIAKCRLYKNIWWHYPVIALIGFIPSAICGLFLILIDGIHKWQKFLDIFIFFFVLGLIGMISSLILTPIALPKYIKESGDE